MKSWLIAFALFAASFGAARHWLATEPPAKSLAVPPAQSEEPPPAATVALGTNAPSARPTPDEPASQERPADAVLEQAMTEHLEAMLMLREAIHYAYFLRDGELARCGKDVAARRVCWVRFRVALDHQQMALDVATIDCNDRGFADCVRAALPRQDMLGIPSEAADELGSYRGPVDVPFTWYPAVDRAE